MNQGVNEIHGLGWLRYDREHRSIVDRRNVYLRQITQTGYPMADSPSSIFTSA